MGFNLGFKGLKDARYEKPKICDLYTPVTWERQSECCWLQEEPEVGIACDGYHAVRGREYNYRLISGSDDCRHTGRYGKC